MGETFATVGNTLLAPFGLGKTQRPVMPPSPVESAQQMDQSQQTAQQDAMKRESIAGGIQSTIGTAGGQAGQMLNPANMGGHSLLGE